MQKKKICPFWVYSLENLDWTENLKFHFAGEHVCGHMHVAGCGCACVWT